MLTNGMAALVENIYMTKVDRPFWTVKFAEGNITEFEAWRSQSSKALILANLTSLESIYKHGLYDYLDHLNISVNAPLATRLSQQFSQVKASLLSIPKALEVNSTDYFKQHKTIIKEIRQLLVLIKVETANHLGVTIISADGD